MNQYYNLQGYAPTQFIYLTIHIRQLDRRRGRDVLRQPRPQSIFRCLEAAHFPLCTLTESLHSANFLALLTRPPPLPIRISTILTHIETPTLPFLPDTTAKTTRTYNIPVYSVPLVYTRTSTLFDAGVGFFLLIAGFPSGNKMAADRVVSCLDCWGIRGSRGGPAGGGVESWTEFAGKWRVIWGFAGDKRIRV